ncbi:hypothetical protein XELAEV_18025847mg [Xenopus laevis]|uniref:Uncharacterized protein n=1 Tax=Xenopus laevis TaxID=8355 RepID=A0A974D0E2_XENLA|nr:hypothetical protein XELAEV_18025847mg [Xenopus laevis]
MGRVQWVSIYEGTGCCNGNTNISSLQCTEPTHRNFFHRSLNSAPPHPSHTLLSLCLLRHLHPRQLQAFSSSFINNKYRTMYLIM